MKLIQDRRFNVVYMDPSHQPCAHNRNRCHKEAVDRGFDFLLMIDADNPPKNNPLDLVDLDKDVIGGPTMVYRADKGGIYWNVMDWNDGDADNDPGWKPNMKQTGLVECDAVGSGCILISRRVLCALSGKQPWNREWDEHGYVTEGTDFAFCKRAKALGYRIWGHYEYWCEHYKEHAVHEYTQCVAAEVEQRMKKQNGSRRIALEFDEALKENSEIRK